MSTIIVIVSGLGVLGSLAWIAHLVHLAKYRGSVVFLSDLANDPPVDGWPTLAIVFAARDESGAVEAACRSMLGQDYPSLEVIAVDDRSTDDTGAILDKIQREESRLRVVHIDSLPLGWLGKTHALQLGSEATEARWLLFTDADVILSKDVMKQAVRYAEIEGIDHIIVGPSVPTESVGERVFLSMFGLLFSINATPKRVANMRSKAHVGIGAFNLVRTRAFRDIGGFSHIALSVDDDMRLGQALKFAGYRPRFLLGSGAVSVRWQVGLGGMIRGLEKNFFAAADFRLEKVAAAALAIVAIGVAPDVGLFVGPTWARIVCGLGILSVIFTLAAASRQSQIAWYYAFLMPIAAITLLIALGRSVAITLINDGVRWRGHHYPLVDLKRHAKLRNSWSREVWRSTR